MTYLVPVHLYTKCEEIVSVTAASACNVTAGACERCSPRRRAPPPPSWGSRHCASLRLGCTAARCLLMNPPCSRLSWRSRNSLTHVIGQLHEREAQLAAVTEERDRSKVEATRLRRELNEAFAGSSAKMMEVAMVASVQALSDEAQHQRRALAEQAILCDEVRGAGLLSRSNRTAATPPRSETRCVCLRHSCVRRSAA